MLNLETEAYCCNECIPLCMRHPQPHEYGSSEMKLAEALFKRQHRIALPNNDLLDIVVKFIIECPDEYWARTHCPDALLPKGSILSKYACSSEGSDVAAICNAIFHYAGLGLNVFDILRKEYSYDGNSHCISHKGVQFWI